MTFTIFKTKKIMSELIRKYIEQFPNSDHPMDWMQNFGEDKIREMLELRNGREIVFVPAPGWPLVDAGELVYKS